MELNFILAPSFHGATVLAQLLNNHPGVSCLGDTMPRTEYDQNCGCGSKVSACEFWRYIDERFAGYRLPYPHRMYPISPVLAGSVAINEALVQSLSVASLLTTPRLWSVAGGAAGKYLQFYREFIDAVNAYNGTSVYVSGQKSMQQVAAIKSILGERAVLNIIHIVRDPRGFACSEKRVMPGGSVKSSARRWARIHKRILRVIRPLCKANFLTVRYEDLCREPRPAMRRIFEFIGVEYQDTCFPPVASHIMGSRANRNFAGTLQERETWKTALSDEDQRICLQITRPLSMQYGYAEERLPKPDMAGVATGRASSSDGPK